MDRKEPAGCENEAQRFCTENYAWLVSASERALNKRGFSGYGRDLAHDIANKCRGIRDDLWAGIAVQQAYVVRMIINGANDFCKESSHLVGEIPGGVLSSSPVKAMEDAILVREIYGWLSADDQKLLELIFEEIPEKEMAERLGISYVALRKRISRFIKRVTLLCEQKGIIMKSQTVTSNRVYRTL